MITSSSIYSTIITFVAIAPRYLYFLISNKRKLPNEMFKGRYLFFFILIFVSFISGTVLTLFFSNDFDLFAKFIGWIFLTHSSIAVQFSLWVIFFVNGYDIHYQFKKIGLPIPMNILEILIFSLTIFLTSNWWAIISLVLFSFSSIFWNAKAFKLTASNNIPINEDDFI